jgi:hypothetical protein
MLFFYSDFVQIFREINLNDAKDGNAIERCLNLCEKKAGKQFKEEEEKFARKKLKSLLVDFKRGWKKVNRKADAFENKFKDWLKKSLYLELSQDFKPSAASSLKGPGRNEKSFQKSSDRTKNRKRDRMIASNEEDPELFLAATIKVAKRNNEHDLAHILDSVMKEPDKKKMRRMIENPPDSYTPLEAVAIFIDNDESKATYHNLRMRALEKNSNIYPPYQVMADEKKLCYPKGSLIRII